MIKKAEFEVKRLTNGKGKSNLLIVLDEAIEDVKIGTVLMVPYVNGFQDPTKVLIEVDENGNPKLANGKFAIVFKYIY